MNRKESVRSTYFNRDLSWLEFNKRVLEEAQDHDVPLLERIKFLSIVSSNLDEFMSVRVAGLLDQLRAGYNRLDFSGYTPQNLLRRIMKRTEAMLEAQYRAYRELMRSLQKENLIFQQYVDLNSNQQNFVNQYFQDTVFPILTPMAIDQSRPFPLVHSQSIYLVITLKRDGDAEDDKPYIAILQVPSNLPRFLGLPSRPHSKKREFILLEDIIRQNIAQLFFGYTPVAIDKFRLTRNADMTLNEEGAEDLLVEIEKELRKRRWGAPVRLEICSGMSDFILQILIDEFEIPDHVFVIDGPMDLTYLMKFSMQLTDFDHLRYPKLDPEYPREFDADDDLLAVMRERDVIAYHPFESFEAVTDFVVQSAHDPQVLAIKMTLYRVSGQSELIQALAAAAESGKQVTVVVELKARFDEERNIAWAKTLEKAGCHVVYGLVGLKTHCKITLVVRQEEDGVRRYVHVGTGNYNDMTARLYTDLGLFTTNPMLGRDASALFNEMTGYSAPYDFQAIAVAPLQLRPKLIELIQREREHARNGKPARIIAKMNSLSNQQMVDELYKASQDGVKIDLIIRGVCCLKPGYQGLSENITVRSIVDRFLEHSRIFYFENCGDTEVWLSSADWMTRNLTRRIELMVPLFDLHTKQTAMNVLNLNLNDTVKARVLDASGNYKRILNREPVRSQFLSIESKNWKSS